MLTYECTEGSTLCNFMCIFGYRLLFNILNSLCRLRCNIVRVHLSLIVFYCGVRAAKNGVWLTDSFFLIFGRGHIQIAHYPPMPPPRPPCASVAPAHCVAWHCRSQVNQRSRMHSTQRKDSSMNSKT